MKERRTSGDGVILWGVPYGILDRNKSSNGVNDLFQEGKPYLESKGFKIISVAPEVGDNSNNVADYNLGKTISFPGLTKITGTSLPIAVPFDKRGAKRLIKEIKPHFLFLEEPTASFGFLAHGLISAIVSRHHAGVYAEKTEKLYRSLLEFGKLIRRPEFTWYGIPSGGVTASMRTTIFENIDRRIAISCATAQAFKKRLNDGAEYEIIHNGINTDELTMEGPIIEDWKKDGKDIILCAVGRHEPRKGIEHAINAYTIIRRERPNTKLIIAGDGPERERFEDLVAELDLSDDVMFVGRLSRSDYVKALRTADVCICPALGGEGFGRVVVEPLSVGTPVVLSNIPGYDEAAGGGKPFALLTEPRNSEDIAQKTLDVLSWPKVIKENMGWLASIYVRERFAWPIIAEQIAKVLDDAYRKHGGVDWSKLPQSETLYEKKT